MKSKQLAAAFLAQFVLAAPVFSEQKKAQPGDSVIYLECFETTKTGGHTSVLYPMSTWTEIKVDLAAIKISYWDSKEGGYYAGGGAWSNFGEDMPEVAVDITDGEINSEFKRRFENGNLIYGHLSISRFAGVFRVVHQVNGGNLHISDGKCKLIKSPEDSAAPNAKF